MRARPILVLAAALVALPADAQLYRHRDPETGQTKLTNVPPPGAKPTTIVIVFEGNVCARTALLAASAAAMKSILILLSSFS